MSSLFILSCMTMILIIMMKIMILRRVKIKKGGVPECSPLHTLRRKMGEEGWSNWISPLTNVYYGFLISNVDYDFWILYLVSLNFKSSL